LGYFSDFIILWKAWSGLKADTLINQLRVFTFYKKFKSLHCLQYANLQNLNLKTTAFHSKNPGVNPYVLHIRGIFRNFVCYD